MNSTESLKREIEKKQLVDQIELALEWNLADNTLENVRKLQEMIKTILSG